MLNVDMSMVEIGVARLMESDGYLNLIQGDLMDRYVADNQLRGGNAQGSKVATSIGR